MYIIFGIRFLNKTICFDFEDNSEQTYILGCMEEFFNFNFDAFKTIQTAKLCKLEILESAFIESGYFKFNIFFFQIIILY
jgi:hypothetical protein